MAQTLGYNDGILLASLIYSCADLLFQWDLFSTCSQPVHQWLLVSYACVIGFRLTHLVGANAIAAPASGTATALGADFLLDLRHKGTLPRLLTSFTWAVALPFFTLWTLVGTSWLWSVSRETPQCVPSAMHLWFSGFWLALCYIWIFIHAALGTVAWVLERRVRRAEGDLRAIEDDDVISRWGHVSSLAGYQSLTSLVDAGLTPAEIRSLPSETLQPPREAAEVELGVEAHECPICICELQPGESVRRLPGCAHAFHRSCIDLWLLRNSDCPLCKSSVREELRKTAHV